MIKILWLCIILSMGISANSQGLFGKVINVTKDDTLNARIKPNYKSKKVGEFPVNAIVGIDQCRQNGKSRWCKIYELVQNHYNEERNFTTGWVNSRYLKETHSGYVTINDRVNKCYFTRKCTNYSCLVITDANMTAKGVTKVYGEWIDKSKLRGESRFGAATNGMDGYCNMYTITEQYLSSMNGVSINYENKLIKSVNLKLYYPDNLNAKLDEDGGLTLYKDIKLTHYSGSDERDNAPLLFKKRIFSVSIKSFDSLKLALDYGYGKFSPVYESYYDKKKDWFYENSKSNEIKQVKFFNKNAYVSIIGLEGSGVRYYYYKQDGKVILLTIPFDNNPPRSPKVNKKHYHDNIKGHWNLIDEKELMDYIVSHLEIIQYSIFQTTKRVIQNILQRIFPFNSDEFVCLTLTRDHLH